MRQINTTRKLSLHKEWKEPSLILLDSGFTLGGSQNNNPEDLDADGVYS